MKNVIQSTVLSANGGVAVAPGARIEVRSPSGLLVPLWLDREGTQPTSNPLYADSSGFFRAYADAGRYHVAASQGGQVQEWRDVLLGSAAGYDVGDLLATVNAGVYPGTVAGLAATDEGGYFSVPSSDPDEYLILYRKISGAAVEQGRYPSAQAVRDAIAGLAQKMDVDAVIDGGTW